MKKKYVTRILLVTMSVVLILLAGCKKEEATVVTDDSAPVEETTETTETVKEDITEEPLEVEEPSEPTFEELFSNEVTLTDKVFEYYAKNEWQTAYRDVLNGIAVENQGGEDDGLDHSFDLNVYALYDIDKDGTPELLLTSGTCEADYKTEIFYCKGSTIEYGGYIWSGHSQFYTYPEGNGLVKGYAHMGYGETYFYTFENGEIVEAEEPLLIEDLFAMEDNGEISDYTPVSEIVEGAEAINFYSNKYKYGLLAYEGSIVSDGEIAHADFEKKINGIFLNDETFYDVPATSYWEYERGLLGEKTIQDIYENPDKIGSTNGERVVKDYYYGDFDGDGYEECLAVLEEGEYGLKQLVLFTYQNGKIFGYESEVFYNNSEVEVVDDIIYICSDYSCLRYVFDYCLDQCTYESYLLDKAPMSETAQEGLTRFRQDLKADGGELGVCLLGWSGTYSGTYMYEVLDEARNKYADEEFMREISRLKVVSLPGEEVYLLVPGSDHFKISIYEVIWGDDTADGMPQRGELIYEAGRGEPVIVKGNQSDIVSNIEVSMRANGKEVIYNPSLSLEDGKVSTSNKVVDFTRYN